MNGCLTILKNHASVLIVWNKTRDRFLNWTIFFLGTLHVQNILCDWCDKINYLRQDTRLCTAPFSTFKSFDQKSSLKVGKKCVHFAILKRILRINCLAKNSLLRNMNRGKKSSRTMWWNVVAVRQFRETLLRKRLFFPWPIAHKKGFRNVVSAVVSFQTSKIFLLLWNKV